MFTNAEIWNLAHVNAAVISPLYLPTPVDSKDIILPYVCEAGSLESWEIPVSFVQIEPPKE